MTVTIEAVTHEVNESADAIAMIANMPLDDIDLDNLPPGLARALKRQREEEKENDPVCAFQSYTY